jgi:hypothetical protein
MLIFLSSMTEAEIIALIQAQLALLFKTVRIPELPENFTAIHGDMKMVLQDPNDNKTKWEKLSDLATFMALGGDTSTIPADSASKGEYIFDITQEQLDAAGVNGDGFYDTIYLTAFAGKNFVLRIDGRDFLDPEYDVLNAGGFKINIADENLLIAGQRVTLKFAEPIATGSTPSSTSGFIKGFVEVSSNTTLTADDINKVIQLRGDADTLAVTVPEISSLPANSFLIVETTITNEKEHTISGQSGQKFYLNKTSKDTINIRPGESVLLVNGGDGWYVTDAGFQEIYKNLAKPFASWENSTDLNELYLDGSEKNRADYPRLWEKVQTLGTALVSDATWFTASATTTNGKVTPFPNRGKFSTGDGSTTFRLPDFRGMGLMGLIAGTDNDRVANTPGNYQKHMVGLHDHGMPTESGGGVNRQSLVTSANSDEGISETDRTGPYGDSKTVMDNIGIYWKIKV